MSALLLDSGHVLHYEVFGRGKPVLLLHGWLGSWRYWMPTMEALAEHHRTYALDFLGFGDSDKPGTGYTLDDYLRQTRDFLDGLGIAQVSLVGHSLGGVVALRMALEQPQRVEKVILVGTPIHGAALASSLRLGRSPLARLVGGPRAMVGMWMRALKRVSAAWTEMYDEIVEDTEKLDYGAVQESLQDLFKMDLRPQLGRLYTHMLVVYGDRDEFVDPGQAALFVNGTVATSQVVVLENCRHFPFLDEPAKFNRLVLEFLRSELGQTVEVKEEWKRRYRQTEFL